jgi:prophage antirepressor-like protein
MTTSIVQFQFGFNDVRVVLIDGEPWLVAKDVCEVLGLADVSRSCERLDDDEKDTHTVSTLGGDQDMIVISESGFYRLVMTSRKPSVKKFQKWITSEVIPSIRKTGTYSIAHPVSVPAILPEVRAVQIANSIRHITDTLDDNPRLAQLLIDLSISGIVEKTNLLTGTETHQLRGVAEIAAEMKLPVNIKNRGDLGKFVVAAGFTPKTEKRLVNGAMRDVNCYPDTPELRQSIEQFFN